MIDDNYEPKYIRSKNIYKDLGFKDWRFRTKISRKCIKKGLDYKTFRKKLAEAKLKKQKIKDKIWGFIKIVVVLALISIPLSYVIKGNYITTLIIYIISFYVSAVLLNKIRRATGKQKLRIIIFAILSLIIFSAGFGESVYFFTHYKVEVMRK